MNMYKVHFENRFIIISPEPDRLQKYGLFHKFHDTNELYKLISGFQSNKEISSINVYGPDIKFIWKLFRIYFTEVEAAGGIVKHTSGKYLFIVRKGMWDLPKGHIERGETPEVCAIREVHEECGISNHKIIKSLEPSFHTYMWEGISYLKKTHWFLMSYDEEIICVPQTEEGITRVEWLFPDEISNIKKLAWLSLNDLINSSVFRS
jgi:8-oxo-dGTP pyrophosphatase MutT (NUDIX family)